MSFPIVPIASIPASGLRTAVSDWARGAASDGLEAAVSSVGGKIELLRRGPHVLARGEIEATGRRTCDRCGELLDQVVRGELACVYSPLAAIPTRDGDVDGVPDVPDEFAGMAEDVGEHDGESIDLAQVVREFCAVERPLRYTCASLDPAQDDACLARWRLQAGPPPSEPTSPFSALKNLKP